MTKHGVSEGEPLEVDLRDLSLATLDDLWDAIHHRCGLPDWFGRNLDTWNDTLRGGISNLLDSHPFLVIQVEGEGLFAPDNPRGQAFREVTDASGEGRVEVRQTR